VSYRALLLAAAFLVPGLAQAQVYKWVDENGTVHYGSRAPANTKVNQLDAPATSNASGASSDSLEGTWKIIQMGRDEEDGTSSWEFHQGRFTQVLEGRRLASDSYTVRGNTVDLGYGKLVVSSNDGQTLKAKLGGVDYVLVKTSNTADRTPKPRQQLTPEAKKSVDAFAEGLMRNVDMSAKLDCPKSAKNSQQSLDQMTGMVEKNYLDGYMDKAQHDKALKGIREATSQISPADCQGAQGKKRLFYQCMSSDKNLFMACAKAHNF